MKLIILRKIDNPQLKEAWKRMEQAKGVSPFMYYDYMRYIWHQEKCFSAYSPAVACVKEGDEFLMLLPLKWDMFKRRYKTLGDILGCGHNDALFNTRLGLEECQQCVAFFYSHIDSHLRLSRLPEDSLLLKEKHVPLDTLKCVNMVRINFDNGVDALLKSLSRNGKESVRRAYNRMKRDGIETELRIYRGDEISKDKAVWKMIMHIYLDRMFDKHKRGGVQGKKNKLFKFLYDFKTTHLKHDTKSLRFLPNNLHAVLMHGNKVMAFCLCMMDHHGEWLVNPRLAINIDYGFYSPGYALLVELMRYLEKETHCRLLDLSRGTEQYKTNLGGIVYHTYQIDC